MLLLCVLLYPAYNLVLLFIAGKDARKSGAGSFITAASLKYQDLDEDEKARLVEMTCETTKEMTRSEQKKAGAKIFKKIQKQVPVLPQISTHNKGIRICVMDQMVGLMRVIYAS